MAPTLIAADKPDIDNVAETKMMGIPVKSERVGNLT